MKLIWHIIRKDILRDRWALALWALLFVGQVVLGVMARNPGELDPDYSRYLQSGSVGLVVLQVVMGYILVARLVQADVLIGTTAFWLTRPISTGRLLIAKALGALLLFGLLPVLLLLPWWLYCAFGWRDIFWTAVDVLGWQLLVIAPAFFVASLTDDLGRVLLWTLLLVIALFSWIVLLQVSFGPMAGRVGGKDIAPWMFFSKIWVSAIALVAMAGAVAAHQYLTRHFVRSVLLVVGGLALIAAIGRWWGMNLSVRIASLHEPAVVSMPGLADQLSVRVESAAGARATSPSRGRVATEDARIQVLLRASGLPEGLSLGIQSANQTWLWADGVRLTRGGVFSEGQSSRASLLRRQYSLPVPETDEETKRWEIAQQKKTDERLRLRSLDAYQPPQLPADKQGLLINQNRIPNSFFAKMQTEAPAYRAELSCVIYRSEVLVELPVQHESRASGGSATFHFRLVGKDDEALIMTHPAVSISGLWSSASFSGQFRYWRLRHHSIMQVTRGSGDIVEGRGWGKGSGLILIAGVAINWNVFDLKSPKVIRDGRQVAKDPQWREHTFLAIMVDREVGRFNKVVSTEKFEVATLQPFP